MGSADTTVQQISTNPINQGKDLFTLKLSDAKKAFEDKCLGYDQRLEELMGVRDERGEFFQVLRDREGTISDVFEKFF